MLTNSAYSMQQSRWAWIQVGWPQQLHPERVHLRRDSKLLRNRVRWRTRLPARYGRAVPRRHHYRGHCRCGHHGDSVLYHFRHVSVDLQALAEAVLVVGLRRTERVLETGLVAIGRGRSSEPRGAHRSDAGGRGLLTRRGQRLAAQLRLTVPWTEQSCQIIRSNLDVSQLINTPSNVLIRRRARVVSDMTARACSLAYVIHDRIIFSSWQTGSSSFFSATARSLLWIEGPWWIDECSLRRFRLHSIRLVQFF